MESGHWGIVSSTWKVDIGEGLSANSVTLEGLGCSTSIPTVKPLRGWGVLF